MVLPLDLGKLEAAGVIKEHRRSFKVLRLAADLGLVVALYYALFAFTLHVANPLGLVIVHPDYRLRLALVFAACWIFAFLASGTYDKGREEGYHHALRVAATVTGLMLLAFALGLFLFKIQFLSRKFVLVYSLLSVLALSLSKATEMRLLRALRRTGFNVRSILLVGEGEELRQAAAFIQGHGEWGYRFVGALGLKSRPDLGGLGRGLGTLKDLGEVLRTRIVDEVFFAAPASRQGEFRRVLEQSAEAGVQVRLLLEAGLRPWHAQLDQLEYWPVLAFSAHRHGPYALMLKGLFDRLGAAVLLVVLSPLLLLCAAGIAVSMGAPVFFVQKRAGKGGRAFFLHKFRTMVADARAQQAALAGENVMGGPVFKAKRDPRVTPLGSFLRRTSLDELPQLLNVLKGELSLVGPRPMAMYEARKVPAWARGRWAVKPGITCYWQVMGRSRLSFDEWMRLDMRYIREWSLWLDLKLLLRTLPAVLTSKGAY